MSNTPSLSLLRVLIRAYDRPARFEAYAVKLQLVEYVKGPEWYAKAERRLTSKGLKVLEENLGRLGGHDRIVAEYVLKIYSAGR